MKTAKISLLAALMLSAAGLAAETYTSQYYVAREVALSGSAEAVTIQIPAATGLHVKFQIAQVWCSTGSVEVSVERDGTAATTTSLTVQKVNPSASWVPASAASAFHTSNAGAGAQVGIKQTVYAGTQGLSLDMSPSVLERNSAGVRNLTIRSASYTGTIRIFLLWEERASL